MEMIHHLVYPILIVLLVLLVIMTIPRRSLRILVPYGVVFGGLLSSLHFFFLGNVFKIFRFDKLGIFEVGGIPLLSAVAWTFIVMTYLYFWPKNNRYLGYFYAFSWAFLATAFSEVVRQAKIFTCQTWYYPLPMLLVFSAKFALITWLCKPWDIE